MSRKKILLVDDDYVFLKTIIIALKDKYNVETANNGVECFNKINNIKPDLIVLFIVMRHLREGINVLKKLTSDNETEKIPIILLAGKDEVFKIKEHCDESMIQEHVWFEKPVEPEVLKNIIEELI